VSTVLGVHALSKRYGGGRAHAARQALDGVSFSLAAGELVALVGPNGAGKTTLLSILAGVQASSAGSVVRASAQATENEPTARGSWAVGWVPQTPALYSKLSAAENLELFARLERLPDPRAAAARMLEQTGLRARAREPVSRLSGGNRQRVNVALGLIADPPVLALDEPSSALDPSQRERLWQFIVARVAAGTTVLFSTHNVSEAQRYATRVLVLSGGLLLFDGTPAALLASSAEGELRGQEARGDLERALVSFLATRAAAGGAP